MAVAVRGLYRKWNNIVDDIKVLDADGFKFLTPINFNNSIIDRTYKSAEITFNRRFSNNFQALASYTWSQATGNADRSYSLVAFTSQLLDYPNDDLHRRRGRATSPRSRASARRSSATTAAARCRGT